MKRLIYIVTAAVLLSLWGCKPTEKGYKAAYDAALHKREQAVREQMLPAEGLQSDDGPQLRIVAGDSIYVSRERLRTEDSKPPMQIWCMAVGVYKMSTNAKANAEALRTQGYQDAQALRGTEGRWYAVADFASTLDSIRVKAAKFKKSHNGYPYVGLPKSPVLISSY